MSRMPLNDMIVLKPFAFLMIVTVIVVVPPSVVLKFWRTRSGIIEGDMRVFSHKFHQEILYGIEMKAELLTPFHSSTTNLARTLASFLNQTQLSVFNIESQVAPLMFQAFSSIPHLSQVSLIRQDGFSFSYYNTLNQQPIAVYTNTSSLSPHQLQLPTAKNYTCYYQPVNRDSGELYGAATSCPPDTVDPAFLKMALDSTNGNASLGTSWTDVNDRLFLNTAVMDGRGAIALGFKADSIIQSFTSNFRNNGSLFMATKDGQVLSDAVIPNARIALNGNDSVALKLLNSIGDEIGNAGNLTCQANDGTLTAKSLTIQGKKYNLYCSELEIVGVELVFVLVMPFEGPEGYLHKNFNMVFTYLLVTICFAYVFACTFVVLNVIAGERVLELRAEVMKQKEATRQAERKGINKSAAYAAASHDVRASLAGITGLIDICQTQVDRGSELDTNLAQMKSCSEDLLGLLNKVLDRSKLEAGSMTLDEEEFEVSKLVEDVADLFHTVGMRKGVDVVLDLCDGSVNKFDRVKGDRSKLKQILCNLVSNAVKFTSEGHVSIRAYARKPGTSNSRLASTKTGLSSWLSCCFYRKREVFKGLEATTNEFEKSENCMEFVFEVDDTGVGIPKEKEETVFENYVQIKETAVGQEGTGLGLAIVQSLVRVMGGEIEIVPKEVGEEGTCFKFNTYLICETDHMAGNLRDQNVDIESTGGGYLPTESVYSPNVEGSQAVLFIQNEERRKVCTKFMERRGIKVFVAKHYEELSTTLRKIRFRKVLSQSSSSKRSEAVSNRNSPDNHLSIGESRNSSNKSKEVPLSSLDEINQELPPTHRTRTRSALNLVLIVIDTVGAPFRELSRAVAEFRKNNSSTCSRVVWLDNSGSRNSHQQGFDKDKLPASDIIISKPFHGSRLHHVLGLLPEFGGVIPEPIPASVNLENLTNDAAEASTSATQIRPVVSTSSPNIPTQNAEIEEVSPPLSGKKVLVVDDTPLLQRIGQAVLSRLGATVEICANGEEALQTVSKGLSDQRGSETPDALPFHYIFMDCEMPIMNGIEATRRIREEEANYWVHIPIIAVTGHDDGPEIEMMKEAGVDNHICKPVNAAKVEAAIQIFEDNTENVLASSSKLELVSDELVCYL